MHTLTEKQLLTRIGLAIWTVIIGLAISGITAFPLQTELVFLVKHSTGQGIMHQWLVKVNTALLYTGRHYAFLNYGTDWVAFAHIILAVLFIGPLKDAVRNIWVLQFGMIACVLIFPLALIAGGYRDIPYFWRMIDCSFGLVAFIPLCIAYIAARQLEHLRKLNPYFV